MLLDGHFHPLDILAEADYSNYTANTYITGGVGASSHPKQWDSLRRWGRDTNNPFVLGIHPWQAANHEELSYDSTDIINVWLGELERLLQTAPHPCGVGEIGFDSVHQPKADFSLQRELFCRQYCLASQHRLPVVIHCVKAYNQLFEALSELKKFESLFRPHKLLHAFWGSPELGKRLIKMGFFISINSKMVAATASDSSPAAVKLKLLAEVIPIRNLILESDSPWGLPYPQQISNLARLMAPYWHVDADYFQNCCSNNLHLFFNL
ncbi:MAG: TatD family hydrolase [Candidatus Bruticola sp.]